MIRQPCNCKLTGLLLSLLLATAGPAGADSPDWADEGMLFVWPDSLADGAIDLPEPPQPVASGRVTISDDQLQPASAAVAPAVATTPEPPPKPATLPWESDYELVGLKCLDRLHAQHGLGSCSEDWSILPAGMLYKSYIAGEKEPRMAAAYLYEKDRGSVFEATIGGRLGFLRYGTPGPVNPKGFQWDLEGAAMLRQDFEQELDVEATDFRVGSVLTWRRGPTAVKAGYYHLSSHLGDEFLLRNPGFPRLNYLRDALLVGVRHRLTSSFEVYGEIAYAVKTDGGAEPLELQFGLEYTPLDTTDATGAPVVAVNGHLREEFDFGGSVNIIAGWEWRGRHSNRRLRIGGQYYNGKEIQWSFFDESVSFSGVGIWYDF